MPVNRSDPPSLSIVVPARNEAAGIEWALGALVESLRRLRLDGAINSGEIVVADDHSTDATARQVRALATDGDVAIHLVPVTDGRGLGAAVRAGLRAASGDLVVYTDADLPFDPDDIGRLLKAADRYRADVVCGYRLDRTLEGGRRGIQSHAYNLLVRTLLPVHVRDVNFACKMLRRPVVDAVLGDLVSEGPFIDAELVARCTKADFHVVQIGVDYFPRRGTPSTLGGPAATVTILRELAAHGRKLRRLE